MIAFALPGLVRRFAAARGRGCGPARFAALAGAIYVLGCAGWLLRGRDAAPHDD
ncbi:hypothetical protein EV699_1173 [Plasticicumulans lactativorans]|uniref:Uncharacterized protein n=1 Tax=Plasticicumulans lactativorans TaxID=1133106 RepID=A0A4R2KZX8_9GAMM|nr:hypothetical protein [Plasticicumulans lactativorans]TCO79694.1 hypothetical protein EV699_1173 [Plasticicumulans lactativorans]